VAGGFDDTAARTKVRITHLNADGTTKVYTVNPEFPNDDFGTPIVQPGDIVFVPQILLSERKSILVLGAVREPGLFLPTAQNPAPTLTDAIASAGGINPLADIARIRLTQPTPGGTALSTTVNLDAIQRETAPDPMLIGGDVIFVPERKL